MRLWKKAVRKEEGKPREFHSVDAKYQVVLREKWLTCSNAIY
jgi:hypothetical protein